MKNAGISSDNTGAGLVDRQGSRVDFRPTESRSSDNKYLSSLATKCLQHRTMEKPKGDYAEFLSSVFGCSAPGVLARMYVHEQMSVADIRTWLVENIGWCVSERQVNVILRRSGIALRGYGERKRLSWKQGKMDGAIAKLRQRGSQIFFISSTVENMVRYLLQVSLSALDLPWHVVVGDHLQLILPRYEVDIPIVAVNPSTGFSCRFAVEVDSTFAHGSVEVQMRDRVKDEALQKSGWIVYRINGDNTMPLHIVPQVVDVAVDIKRVCQEVLSIDGRTDCHTSEPAPPLVVL